MSSMAINPVGIGEEKLTNIAFNVPGIIKGKGRPRFVRSTGRAYTPQATLSGEQWVKHCALQAGIKPLEGAIALEIAMHLPVPRSWTRKRRQEALGGLIRPTGKPDLDNVAKLCGDALNGVAWMDDSQIASLTISRHYVPDDQVSSDITITVIGGGK